MRDRIRDLVKAWYKSKFDIVAPIFILKDEISISLEGTIELGLVIDLLNHKLNNKQFCLLIIQTLDFISVQDNIPCDGELVAIENSKGDIEILEFSRETPWDKKTMYTLIG